ncbi:type II toxin-antitoxin system RelE/ParE family toxin [Cognatiyoonia sp. IB215182]|uniref:type II toxin-antitoxin system RelE/ParE family toxin n=1 Tax=Cognatiyoonia sp. IB215182 TaxID=3097353 RepID=UPI002A112A02|nr:type II toxin-antitoxin system RelE/ParE family toxin [Cognatiyoonia sp. IB215182]MDX8353994.1 type II toxin-antitoxin system RelE/ParE family toxin [Cognatiyoonia sp. IB215182]
MTTLALRITKVADQDLDDLYSEGFKTWGEAQADRYYDGLLERFTHICEHPKMYPTVDHIRTGYRRSVYEKHAIYYVIDD